MAIQNMGVIHPRLTSVRANIFTKFCVLADNFGSRNARKSIKGSKDADHSLVSKKCSLDWRLGPGKDGQKNANPPPLVASPQRTPNPKRKYFSISTRRLAESVEGYNSSLAQSAGELWPEMSRPIQWPTRGLKGFETREKFEAVLKWQRSRCVQLAEAAKTVV